MRALNFAIQVSEKFMDMNVEKNNSAYMLFYEKVDEDLDVSREAEESQQQPVASTSVITEDRGKKAMKDLERWIWTDNFSLLKDQCIFDHSYFK